MDLFKYRLIDLKFLYILKRDDLIKNNDIKQLLSLKNDLIVKSFNLKSNLNIMEYMEKTKFCQNCNNLWSKQILKIDDLTRYKHVIKQFVINSEK